MTETGRVGAGLSVGNDSYMLKHFVAGNKYYMEYIHQAVSKQYTTRWEWDYR